MSGTAYTSSVSGITITSGGAPNTMGGGKEMPIFISTLAIVEMGTAITNTKRIVPKSNFFILCLRCPSPIILLGILLGCIVY